MKVANNQAVIFKLFLKNPKDLKFIYIALHRKMVFKLSPS